MAQEFSLTDAQLEAYRTAEVIFVAQDGYTLAPARVRAYNFAKACRDRGMRAEVLSFRDHLGGCAQGSGVHRMEDLEKLALIQRGAEILIQNPTAVLYMQKIGYHSVACAIASGRNGNRIVVDYDDFDFGVPLFPKLERFFLGLGGDPTTQSLMHAADLCVVSSRKLLEIVERFNPRVRLLSTGADLAVFDAGLRDKAGRQPGDPVEI